MLLSSISEHVERLIQREKRLGTIPDSDSTLSVGLIAVSLKQ